MKLRAHGLGATLPAGWEGSISAEHADVVAVQARAFAGSAAQPRVRPVAHFATFGLPAIRSDFGAAAVESMTGRDIFVSLVEYGEEEAGTALFAAQGLPRRLDPRGFSPRMLQRTLPGQSGLQLFFTEGGRAFCLYVVLGDASDAHRLVRRVEELLRTIEIEERP